MKNSRNNFVGPNGEFVSTQKLEEGTINLAYLYEICEWVYYHNNKTDDEKLKQILALESMQQDLLNEMIKPSCKFNPTWSPKLKRLIAIKKALKNRK